MDLNAAILLIFGEKWIIISNNNSYSKRYKDMLKKVIFAATLFLSSLAMYTMDRPEAGRPQELVWHYIQPSDLASSEIADEPESSEDAEMDEAIKLLDEDLLQAITQGDVNGVEKALDRMEAESEQQVVPTYEAALVLAIRHGHDDELIDFLSRKLEEEKVKARWSRRPAALWRLHCHHGD